MTSPRDPLIERGSTPILEGTQIYALAATRSRHGESFGAITDDAGRRIGQVLTTIC